jgi:hypothetical protein
MTPHTEIIALIVSSATATASTAAASYIWRQRTRPPWAYVIGGACILSASAVFAYIMRTPWPVICTAAWFASAALPVAVGWTRDGNRKQVDELQADLDAERAKSAALRAELAQR